MTLQEPAWHAAGRAEALALSPANSPPELAEYVPQNR